EHRRSPIDRGEVHRLVEVALRRGSVTERGQSDPVAPFQLLRPGQTNSVDHVPADRYRRRQHIHPFGQFTTTLVAGTTENEKTPWIAGLPVENSIPIGAHHPVAGTDRRGRSD